MRRGRPDGAGVRWPPAPPSPTVAIARAIPLLPDVHSQLRAVEFVYRLFPRDRAARPAFLAALRLDPQAPDLAALPQDPDLAALDAVAFEDRARRYLARVNATNDGVSAVPLCMPLRGLKCVCLDDGAAWASRRWDDNRRTQMAHSPPAALWLDIDTSSMALSGSGPTVRDPLDIQLPFARIRSFSVIPDTEICLIVDSQPRATSEANSPPRRIITLWTPSTITGRLSFFS
ncbi:hypothetical protein HK105_200596 [Polyrhizophydium stewartii]|uniref:Uncharacterized protein n=1 Tax=Polyrhizophydium stewartii TaxID=2732419 RepID=A0ABR4NJI1_9FUNG